MLQVGALELCLLSLGCALGAGASAAVHRAQTRYLRRVHRAALTAERACAEAGLQFAQAARTGAAAVRDALAAALDAAAPDVGGILMYDESDGALACVHAGGERLVHYAGSRIALDDSASLVARALATGHHVRLEPGLRALYPGDGAALAIPLSLVSGRASIVAVTSRVAPAAATVEYVVRLVEQASPAYVLALEREHDRERAEYDGLTGLLTPRAFRARLARLIERARVVPAARVALAFVDTDRFKDWNDAYGHACGDALLRELARVLRGAVRRDDDLVARNGGDEFCLVFTETSKGDAIERAERLRARIGALDCSALRPPGSPVEVRITASIGVAAYPLDAADAPALLERADAAMYHSKRSGRNAVSYVDPHGAFARLGDPAPDGAGVPT